MTHIKDMVGQVCGKWEVLSRAGSNERGEMMWLCRCSCEDKTEKIVNGCLLRNGQSKSCGCYNIEVLRSRATLHGHGKAGEQSSTYHTWSGMISRCFNPNAKAYHDYGGRGITVCDRWRDFAAFLEDMGEKPDGLTIERVNNNLGYSKDNCRWITQQEQMMNRRNNIMITYKSQTKCLKQWAIDLGLNYDALHGRYRKGWSHDEIISTPIRFRKSPQINIAESKGESVTNL